MASLENKKIKDTYEGLLKTDDNAAIDGAVEITDGAGNGTGVTISNDGQVTATGTVSFGSLKDTGEDITVTKFVDEADGIGNNDNDTSVPTSAAVKDYVDTNVTAQDLDFQGDSGTGSIDLDSQSLDIAGGTGIDTAASGQTLTVNIDSTVATLSDTQTLTNKTVDADNNTVSNLEVDNLKSGVLDTDLTSVSASDDTLASAKAIKTYVDSNITAQDLDITDGTTTSAVDLDSQTLTIEGTANEVEVSLTDQTFTVGLPTSITTNVTGNLTGNVTGNLTGNVTGDVTGNADTASALETARTISLSGDVAGSVSFDGSANADITATIQANSVALGTDTTGDYVESLGTGTGVTIGSNTGEGSSPTISVDYGSTANTAVQGDTSLTIQGTANEIEVSGGGVTLGSGGTVTVGLPDDVSLGGSLTIAQNLTVNGTTTTVNTDTLSVEDPLIELARDNSENSVDVGLYGKYSLDSGVTTKYSGLFKDASDSDKFKLFKGLEVEPTSTVDTSGTGYTKGDLVVNDLDAVDGVFSGQLGLGTSSPSAQLHLTNSNDAVVKIESIGTDSTDDSRIELTTTNGTFSIQNDRSIGTSGALTFAGNTSDNIVIDHNSGNVGIGTSSPDHKLHLEESDTTSVFLKTENTAGALLVGNNSSGNSFLSSQTSGKDLLFETANTERMRIDSSGRVGLGTSSPAALLSLQDGSTEDVSGSKIRMELSGINPYWEIIARNGGTSANRQLGFYTSSIGSDVMTLTQSGNVGIGETPSPISGDKIITLKGTSNYATLFVKSNLVEGLFRANNTDTTLYIGTETNHPFALVTNGAERMRIDSSGNVGLGTSSPDFLLSTSGTGTNRISVNSTNSGTSGVYFRVLSGGSMIGNGTIATQSNGDMKFFTGTSSEAERMRITSDSNPTLRLGVSGTGTSIFEMKSASGGSSVIDVEQFLQIKTSGSERMRITSGGNVLVGCTSLPDASTSGFVLTGTSSGNRSSSGSSTTAYNHLLFYNGNGIVGSISTSGSATAYNTSSDYRLKENVVDLTGALDRVDQLEPKRFNFIADEETTVDGFLAHEVQDIVPEAVTGEKDAVDEDGNDIYQGIDQSKLVPLLVGAIKELNAKVAALEAQINN